MTQHRISPLEWHGWQLDPGVPALVLRTGEHTRYEIELDRMLDAPGVLFWIMDVLGKEHWTDQELRGLLTAVDDVLDPRRSLCAVPGDGATAGRAARPYTATSMRARVAAFAGAWPGVVSRGPAGHDPAGASGIGAGEREWQKAVGAEPRLGALKQAVLAVAYEQSRAGEFNPDGLYQDAKRYLAVLLGFRRGEEPESRYAQPPEHEARFAAVVGGPGDSAPEHEDWLRRQDVLDVCGAYLYDSLSTLDGELR